jgi:hypothetical protein
VPLDFEPIRGFIEIEVRDSKGNVIQKGKHKMRSFLNNFLKTIEAFARGANVTVTNTAGGSSTFAYAGTRSVSSGMEAVIAMNCMAGDNDSSFGIVVGTGTTPVSLVQYALASQIPHGTGTGQLDYNPSSGEILGLDTRVSPPVYRFRILRTFTNSSGGSITINEVGLIAYHRVSAIFTFMIARDVLPQPYVVPNGGTCTIALLIEVVLG